ERERVFLLDEVDDRVVELVARDANRLTGNDATQRDDGDFGGAATDVDDHVAGRFVHGQAGADRGRHRLFDDVRLFTRARLLRRFLYGALLDSGDARRHADHHARLRPLARVHALDEVAEHLLADVEVGDDAVLERTDGFDVLGRAPDHLLRFDADGERT